MQKSYPLSNATTVLLERSFLQHPPKDDQVPRFAEIQRRLESLARGICTLLPDSPEQKEFIRCVREAGFWAEEAIKKNEFGGR